MIESYSIILSETPGVGGYDLFPVSSTNDLYPNPSDTSTYDPDIPIKLINCSFSGFTPLFMKPGIGYEKTNPYLSFYLSHVNGLEQSLFVHMVGDKPQTVVFPMNIMLERGDTLKLSHWMPIIGSFSFMIDTRPYDTPSPESIESRFAAECDPYYRGIHSVPNYV